MKIALVTGSLRKDSYNTSALRFVEANLPAGVEATWVSIDLPIYNSDIDTPETLPAPAKRVREQLKDADAVLISTPEYNYAIAGGVKNFLDWASRPPHENIWKGKPVGIIGASPGFSGTARGQAMTKAAFLLVGAQVFSGAEVLIGEAHNRFDDKGQLKDELSQKAVRHFITKFTEFVGK